MTPLTPRRGVLGLGIIAVGVISAIAMVVISMPSLFASLLRVDVPGSAELHLNAGHYSVFYESAALASEDSKAPGITIGIQPKEGGNPVAVSNDILFPLRYSTDHYGALSAEFTIDHPGDYRITVAAPLYKQPAPGNISIARGLGVSGFVRISLIPFTLFWGGIGAGLFILLKRPKAA